MTARCDMSLRGKIGSTATYVSTAQKAMAAQTMVPAAAKMVG